MSKSVTESNLFNTALGQLRIIAFLEGISYLLLLGIAMPLKYLAGEPSAVKVIGMIHGILFVLYVFYILLVKLKLDWSLKKTVWAFLASLIPLGTFYADVKLFRK